MQHSTANGLTEFLLDEGRELLAEGLRNSLPLLRGLLLRDRLSLDRGHPFSCDLKGSNIRLAN